METVYITGHRNPDMDSVCAAFAYSRLKQEQDPHRRYVPVRCGRLNSQTKSVFTRVGIGPPVLMNDIRTRVREVTRRDIVILYENEPVYRAIEELDKKSLSMIPVLTAAGDFAGTITIHEISAFLVNENLGHRPRYSFIVENIPRVLPGRFYSRGTLSEFSAPLMIGAMPYDTSIERISRLDGELPLLIAGLRTDLIEYAVKTDLPGIVLTGIDGDEDIPVDFSGYSGIVYISGVDTAETTRLLRLSAPIGGIINRQPVRVEIDAYFDDAKKLLLDTGQRGLPVFENGVFRGIVTRRCFLEKPKPCLILVDHNELDQSIEGAEEAHIHDIVDHHRIDLPKTREPIHIDIRPLGSTCTIIFKKYRECGMDITGEISLLLLSGILSDTVLLKSPTTTADDRAAVEELSKLADVDWNEWGTEMFSHAATLKGAIPEDVICGDFKSYEHNAVRFGIGQVEVSTFSEIPEIQKELLDTMSGIALRKGLDWIMLLVTHVLEENSILLSVVPSNLQPRLVYRENIPGQYDLPGILSRKKQLIPEVLRALDESE